jgi:hypothetical protein
MNPAAESFLDSGIIMKRVFQKAPNIFSALTDSDKATRIIINVNTARVPICTVPVDNFLNKDLLLNPLAIKYNSIPPTKRIKRSHIFPFPLSVKETNIANKIMVAKSAITATNKMICPIPDFTMCASLRVGTYHTKQDR